MPRFFLPPAAFASDTVTLTGEDCRHISRSLRMAVGDEITLSDGEGVEYTARLSAFTSDSVTAKLLSSRPGEGEPPVRICLYQGNPKGDKLELITQKAVELGVFSVTPFESSRCVARIRADRTDKQTARLARIAAEAAGQCGRARIPHVGTPLSFAEALREAAATCERILFCYEEERECSLRQAVTAAMEDGVSSLAVFVGSEGGFSPEEADAARNAGAVCISLGKRILRCETAPLYALAAIGCIWDF